MTYTWTNHIMRCDACRRQFRASQEAIDNFRDSGYPDMSDAEIAQGFDFCLACVAGESPDGEYKVPRGPSNFEVIERTDHLAHDNWPSHGLYATLKDAFYGVERGNLVNYEIWQGDHIVDEHPKNPLIDPLDLDGEPIDKTKPLYSNSPEEISDNWRCAVCGNTTEFVGVDAHGWGGRPCEQCEGEGNDGFDEMCEHETELTQRLTIDPDSDEPNYDAFEGGNDNSEIGAYTSVFCGKCDQLLWTEG